jgi:hypothetical protein
MLKILTLIYFLLGSMGASENTILDYTIKTISTIDDLKKINIHESKTLISVLGYYSIGDDGGGSFYWKDNDTEDEDGGTIFKNIHSSKGRYCRLNIDSGPIHFAYFGVVPGLHDYSSLADSAAIYCWKNNRILYVPSGNYIYNGVGLGGDSARYSLYGDGRGKTTFHLGKNSYLISSNVLMKSLDIHDISVVGGLGCIQHKYSGVDVQESFKVEGCDFFDYSRCAIYTNSQDMPYWYIVNNLFRGSDDINTIGFAHCGYSDNCTIYRNDFQKNNISIKLKRGGNNCYIFCNDFLRWSKFTSSPRVSIWIVPENIPVNAGPGLCVRNNKFGNENLSKFDYPILFSDEILASDTGDSFPNYALESNGFIEGHIYTDNLCNNIGMESPPFIYSMTKNVRGILVGPLIIAGGTPRNILEFYKKILPLSPDRFNANNIFGPFIGSSIGIEPGHSLSISNGIGIGSEIDPSGINQEINLSNYQNTDGLILTKNTILKMDNNKVLLSGDAAITPGMDSDGKMEASDVKLLNGFVFVHLPSEFVHAGNPMRIEFEIASESVDALDVTIADEDFQSGGYIHARRQFKADSRWSNYSFPWVPRINSAKAILLFRGSGQSSEVKFKIGKIKICRKLGD